MLHCINIVGFCVVRVYVRYVAPSCEWRATALVGARRDPPDVDVRRWERTVTHLPGESNRYQTTPDDTPPPPPFRGCRLVTGSSSLSPPYAPRDVPSYRRARAPSWPHPSLSLSRSSWKTNLSRRRSERRPPGVAYASR